MTNPRQEEEKTWRLFQAYAMHSQSGVLDYLPMAKLKQILRESAVYSHEDTNNGNKITPNELEMICCAARKKINASKISYSLFRAILREISMKLYPDMSPDSALQYFISTRLSKCSKQSAPASIDADIEALKPILNELRGSFQQIYTHYTLTTQNRVHKVTSPKKIVSRVPKCGIKPSMKPTYEDPQAEKRQVTMAYEEFLHFGTAYGLLSRFGVTHMRFAKIYVDCIEVKGNVRVFTLDSFCHSLIHLAKVYFEQSKESIGSKFQALLLVMFYEIRRQCKPTSERENLQLSYKPGVYGSSSYLGCNHFVNSFYLLWKRENFVDYLSIQLH